jgi:glycosyltransferase involved in cell wall biosynthesis
MKPAGDVPRIIMLSPSLSAVSGVSTHASLLFGSTLAHEFEFVLFQVGSQGRVESKLQKLFRLIRSPVQLAAMIARRRAAIVHINTAMDTKAYWRDMWYVAVSRLCGCKVIFQIHGGSLPEEFFAGSKWRTYLLARVLRAANVLVLISQIEQQAYRKFVPTTRIEFIPNAIPMDGLLDADPGKAQRAAALHLVYVGRLVESKGILEAVEAVRLLREQGIEVRLSIAGSGPLEGTLRQIVADGSLQDRVAFLGPVFGAQKSALWCAADVFVFPTYHKEGLPYSLLEAMAAAAVPVISPIGGIPDVMRDGVEGVFVPSRDPAALARVIARLHADRGLVVRMAAAARVRVCQHYTVDRLAKDFRALYLDLRPGSQA